MNFHFLYKIWHKSKIVNCIMGLLEAHHAQSAFNLGAETHMKYILVS